MKTPQHPPETALHLVVRKNAGEEMLAAPGQRVSQKQAIEPEAPGVLDGCGQLHARTVRGVNAPADLRLPHPAMDRIEVVLP
ncbi:hypothetical protein D3C83_55750 [compost metagenome]